MWKSACLAEKKLLLGGGLNRPENRTSPESRIKSLRDFINIPQFRLQDKRIENQIFATDATMIFLIFKLNHCLWQ